MQLTRRPEIATPQYSPSPGTYGSAQNVTITSATPGATIYYTVDGSTPTTSSTLYTGAVAIPATAVLKPVAVKAEMTDSSVQSGTYTIGGGGGGAANLNVGTLNVGTLVIP